MTETEIVRFFNFECQPLLLMLYQEARISPPTTKFDHKIEGPRLVAALREQGFSFQFPTTGTEKT
jgi:hypothetical protein